MSTEDISKLEVRLSRMLKSLDSKMLMGEIGHFMRQSLLDRTGKGIDAEGNQFEPYSVSYKAVRDAGGYPTHIVDLMFSGSMLGALTYEEDEDSVRLFFMDTVDKKGQSNPAKAYYNNEARYFFAISEKERNKILAMVKKHIARSIRESREREGE